MLSFSSSTPIIDWSRPGGELPLGRSFKEEFNTELLIKGLRFEDEGIYKCHASNNVDLTAEEISLIIQCE